MPEPIIKMNNRKRELLGWPPVEEETVAGVTKSVRKHLNVSLERFGQELVKRLPGVTITRAAVSAWETGKRKPDYVFALLVLMVYDQFEWQQMWALQVLYMLKPEIPHHPIARHPYGGGVSGVIATFQGEHPERIAEYPVESVAEEVERRR